MDTAYLWLARRSPTLVADADAYRAFLGETVGPGRTLQDALRRVFTRPQIEHLRDDVGLRLEASPMQASFEQWLALFRARTHLNEDGAQRPGGRAARPAR